MYDVWYKITNWFYVANERYVLIRDFNKASRKAFIDGETPALLEAKITKGDSNYRHAFSKLMGGGFRIKATTGKDLMRSEMIKIGEIILSNEKLVRELISKGWDTLEVHDTVGTNGLKWELRKYANIGGVLK